MFALVIFILMGSDPEGDGAASSIATVSALVLAVVGSVQAMKLRAEVFDDSVPREVSDPAVAGALAARQRRAESRSLASSDPSLAYDLRIGRPDLSREYDDGGLVDVNHVPARILVERLGLEEHQAATVISVRE